MIAKEWAEEMLRRDVERARVSGIEGLELTRHNIREWVASGVVKSSQNLERGRRSSLRVL